MKIGVDIDGTLTNPEKLLKYIAKKFNKKHKILTKEYHKEYYSVKEIFGWTEKQERMFWEEYGALFCWSSPSRQDAARIIRQLRLEGHKVIIITTRAEKGDMGYWNTIHWLLRHGIEWDELYMDVIDKGEFCKDNHINIMIEDYIKHCIEVANKEIPVLCVDNPYNKGFTYKNVNRIYCWKKVYEFIESPERKKLKDVV